MHCALLDIPIASILEVDVAKCQGRPGLLVKIAFSVHFSGNMLHFFGSKAVEDVGVYWG